VKQVISFSVYGQDPKYLIGAIKNAKLARKYFPTWETVFYVSDQIPPDLISELIDAGGRIHLKQEPNNSSGMFWRFNEVSNIENERVLFRDTDSRLSARDAVAVQEWIESGKSLHIIRDHPMHNAPLLGGLWGVIPQALKDFRHELSRYEPKGYYGEDQEFLWKYVYRPLRRDRYVHDEFFMREMVRHRISSPRSRGEFLGESMDEFENIDESNRNLAMKVLTDPFSRKKLKLRSLLMKMLGR
jgi:hypothetical protein